MMACDVIGTLQLKSHILLSLLSVVLLNPPCFSLFLSTSVSTFFDLHTYSRQGRVLHILAAMKHQMPKLTMDCELWYGRGQYSLSYTMVSKTSFFSWDFLRYLLFFLSSPSARYSVWTNDSIEGWWPLMRCLSYRWRYISKIDTVI